MEADGYGTALLKTEYTWGSNLDTANNGLHLYDGFLLAGDKKYLKAATGSYSTDKVTIYWNSAFV